MTGSGASASSGSGSLASSGRMRRTPDSAPPHRRAPKGVASRFRGASDARAAPGEAWERVMHTRLTQWRYMHLVALEELGQSERAACAEIAALSLTLEERTVELHNLEATLAAAAAFRAGQTFAERARPALEGLDRRLAKAAPAHRRVCAGLVDGLRRLVVPPGTAGEPKAVADALEGYHAAAGRLAEAVGASGAGDAAGVAGALAQLAAVAVGMQRDALADAGEAVADAGDKMDDERAVRATNVIVEEERKKEERTGVKSKWAVKARTTPSRPRVEPAAGPKERGRWGMRSRSQGHRVEGGKGRSRERSRERSRDREDSSERGVR